MSIEDIIKLMLYSGMCLEDIVDHIQEYYDDELFDPADPSGSSESDSDEMSEEELECENEVLDYVVDSEGFHSLK